jgi:hypothetical protein
MGAEPRSMKARVPLSSLPAPYVALLRHVGAKDSADGSGWEAEIDARRFRFSWLPATKSEPCGLRIETPAGPSAAPPSETDAGFEISGGYRSAPWPIARLPGPLTLRLENERDRFGKRVGLNREIQLGHQEFDERVYVECDAPDAVVRKLLASEVCRREILQMLELGPTAVTLDRAGALSVSLRRAEKDAPSVARFEQVVRSLGAMAQGLPALRGRAPQLRGALALVLVLVALFGSVLGIPALMLSLWLWNPAGDEPFPVGFLLGFVLWFVSVPLVFLAVRRRSTSLRDFGMYAGFSLLAVPLWTMAMLLAVNGAFDTSPPVAHDQVVVSRWLSRGKSTNYYVRMTPVAAGDHGYQLRIDRNTYQSLGEGARAVVTTRAGALGYEWLISVRPAQ